jgi:hypothetical protein
VRIHLLPKRPTLLETTYGLRLELNGGTFGISDIHLFPLSQERCEYPTRIYSDGSESSTKLPVLQESPSKMAVVENISVPKSRCRYRLFPDWQTSYLWYDDHEPLPSSGQAQVEMNVIDDRYSSLAPYYFEW